jgi:hypothetical protein
MAKTNAELKAAVKKKLAAGASVADLKGTNAWNKLGGSTVRTLANKVSPVSTDVSTDTSPSSSPQQNLAGGSSAPAPSYSGFGNLFQDVLAPFQASLATIEAGATTQSATIRGEADKEVARAYSDAQKYASELSLEGLKYGADKESEWRQALANIEVKGKLDLQPIINAGLERVAGIEAQAQRDVAETTGRYSLESTKKQTQTQENIGKMQLAGSMYGLLSSIFG